MPARTADPSKDGQEVRTTDETTPLLGAPESGEALRDHHDQPPPYTSNGQPTHASATSTNHEGTPHEPAEGTPPQAEEAKGMQYTQVLILCYTALAEPVAYFAIFPFINEMIHLKGDVEENSVGFWSGLIESLFSLVQMVLMIFYGRAADRIGRKPVLVFSLTGIGVATAFFGMSQSLWQMIMFRCLAGMFGGSVVTVRTMLSENCTKETQGRAFSWYMFVRNIGIFIGPLIGGGLANPAEQFPSVFGGVVFWEQYPYALPTIATGILTLSSAVLSLFFLKETLKRKGDGKSKPDDHMSTLELLKSPGVLAVLFIFAHTMLLALAYTAVIPVFMFTSVKSGGFGFTNQWIAAFMAIGGASQALWTLVAFPVLQKNYGTGAVMRWCSIAWPIFMVGWPVMNEFLRHGWTKAFWIAAPIGLALGSGVSMAFACCQLFINDIPPSPTVLGMVNALALTLNSGVRAFTPVLFTSIFEFGVKSGFADGHLVWFFLFALSAGLNVACYFIPEAAEGRPKKSSPADDDPGTVR